MPIILDIVLILLIALFPRVAVLLSDRYKFFKFLGPVFICYALGFLMSFLFSDTGIAMTISEILVPIAIPLILFSVDLSTVKYMAKNTLLSLALVAVAAVCVASTAFFIFRESIPYTNSIAGMQVGLYVGGTINLMAIGMALNVPENLIVLSNTTDMIVGGLYFLMLISVIPKIVGKFLPKFEYKSRTLLDAHTIEHKLESEFIAVKQKFSFKALISRVPIILLAVIIAAISAGLALLITGTLNIVIVMLSVTTLGVVMSLFKKIRTAPGSYNAGQYLIYMFSFALGLTFDFREISLNALMLLLYFFTVQFGIVLFHLLLSKLFKIDAHTAIITSTAGIYGPPFIAPVANALNNKDIVLPGLICGIIGYAIGNYLGIGTALLLNFFR